MLTSLHSLGLNRVQVPKVAAHQKVWNTLREQWEHVQTIHQEIRQLHLAVAAAILDEVQDSVPARKHQVFDAHYDDAAWTREIPVKLPETFPGILPDRKSVV